MYVGGLIIHLPQVWCTTSDSISPLLFLHPLSEGCGTRLTNPNYSETSKLVYQAWDPDLPDGLCLLPNLIQISNNPSIQDRSVQRSINPMIHQSNDPSIQRSINPTIHQSNDPPIQYSINPTIQQLGGNGAWDPDLPVGLCLLPNLVQSKSVPV